MIKFLETNTSWDSNGKIWVWVSGHQAELFNLGILARELDDNTPGDATEIGPISGHDYKVKDLYRCFVFSSKEKAMMFKLKAS